MKFRLCEAAGARSARLPRIQTLLALSLLFSAFPHPLERKAVPPITWEVGLGEQAASGCGTGSRSIFSILPFLATHPNPLSLCYCSQEKKAGSVFCVGPQREEKCLAKGLTMNFRE